IMFVLNKIDKANEQKLVEMTNKLNQIGYEMIIPVSAQLKVNTKTVVEELIKYLPEHPKYFPDDIVSSENERFFVSEIIREKIFELYSEEIPYSTEVVVVDYKERENNKDFIQAEIYIERNSQKGIIIGKNGETIKKLGSLARKDIEEFVGKEVFLDIRVKVKEKWRNSENILKSFGYTSDSE
ncbi:MAG: GTPase Era, partial [Syntrophothermus sp.]